MFIHVTSSFRTSSNVKGAIVKPATRSNHMAGHAIDMNVIYDNKTKSANSVMLGKYPNVPEPVKRFIKSIIDDKGLRWGGKFNATIPYTLMMDLMAIWPDGINDTRPCRRRYS